MVGAATSLLSRLNRQRDGQGAYAVMESAGIPITAGAMSFSSVSVIARALRLRTVRV